MKQLFVIIILALTLCACRLPWMPDLPPYPCLVASPNPMPANQTWSWTHTAPHNNVTLVGVRFSRLRLAKGDLLYLKDGQGIVRETWGGPFDKDDFRSAMVPGRVVKLELDSYQGGAYLCVWALSYAQVTEPTRTCPPAPTCEPTQTVAPTYTPLPTYTPYPTHTPQPEPTQTPAPTATATPVNPLCRPCVVGGPQEPGYTCFDCSGLGWIWVRLSSPNGDCQLCRQRGGE